MDTNLLLFGYVIKLLNVMCILTTVSYYWQDEIKCDFQLDLV